MAAGWEDRMVEELNQAGHGEKKAIWDKYSELTGKCRSTLGKLAESRGYAPERKRRSDKGTLKSGLTEEQILHVVSLIKESSRQVKGTIMSVETALEVAIINGVIEPGQISVSRLQAILRERGVSAADLDAETPHIRMASLHPNYCHVFDASVCIQYYLQGKKGMQIMDERDFYKNKPDNFAKIKTRLIRYVLVDHFSHFLFVKYYNIGGENRDTVHDFLTSAWRGGHHDMLPFQGVPFYVLMDAGAAHTAKAMQAFLRALDIKTPEALPHNPRRQGSAEVVQNIVERQFESRLRFCPADTVEQLNEWCIDWLVHFNNSRKLRRSRTSRCALWQTITQPQLRILPEEKILQDIYAEPEMTRTVRRDFTIPLRNNEYHLKHIEGLRPGMTVTVSLRPYTWKEKAEITVTYDKQAYVVEPIGTLAGGFSANSAIIGQEFKAQPETATQKAVKKAENLAYGEERKKNDVPFGGTLKVFGYQAEKFGNTASIPKRGTPLEIPRDYVPQYKPIMVFINELRQKINHVEPALNRELKQTFGNSIEVNRAEEVIKAICANQDWREVAADQAQAL